MYISMLILLHFIKNSFINYILRPVLSYIYSLVLVLSSVPLPTAHTIRTSPHRLASLLYSIVHVLLSPCRSIPTARYTPFPLLLPCLSFPVPLFRLMVYRVWASVCHYLSGVTSSYTPFPNAIPSLSFPVPLFRQILSPIWSSVLHFLSKATILFTPLRVLFSCLFFPVRLLHQLLSRIRSSVLHFLSTATFSYTPFPTTFPAFSLPLPLLPPRIRAFLSTLIFTNTFQYTPFPRFPFLSIRIPNLLYYIQGLLCRQPSTSASSPETMTGSGRGPRHRSGRGSSQVSQATTASKEPLLSSDGDPRDLENGSVEVEDRRQREGNGRTRMVYPPVAVKRTRDEAEAAGTEGLQRKKGRKVEQSRSEEESCAGALAQPLPQGLPNLGNTCYMNSVLQCLCHVDSLTARLRKLQIDPGHGGVVRATVQLLKALQGGASLDNSVRALKNAMAKRDPNFRDFEQKEAHDFYSQLLNFLHTDMLAAENGRANMGAGGLIEMQEPESFISHLFRIVHLTTLTCPKDPPYDLSTNTEAAFNISLPVSRSGPFSLKELLARYYRQQSLDWDCDRCGTEHECQNSVLVTRQPSVLVLHLSRVSEMEMSAHKCQVTYPMKGLTMPHVTGSTRRSYRLTAVCCHEGGMQSGHYTAFCRRGDHWYSFNDKFVRSVPKSESVLDRPSAHILFYEAATVV